MDTDYILIIVIFFLILLSGFFSGSETGLTGVNKARMHKLASEGNKRAQMVINLRQDKDRLIGAILLGNNVVNIAASMLAALVAQSIFGKEGLALVVATGVMTIMILIFGEVMPKTYAFQSSDKVAIMVAPIWNVLVKILNPITIVVQAVSRSLLKLLRVGKGKELVNGVDALRGAIDMHHTEGSVVKDDRDMLGSILDLSQIEVAEIMVHRKDMTTVNLDDEPAAIVEQAITSIHTRLPVWENDDENIIGVLITKDVLKLDRDNMDKEAVRALLHEPMFTPDKTSLRDQMELFRNRRSHIAIVVDEYGALMGLLTLEDILEEIVGQIEDEHDKVIRGIKKQSGGGYKMRGNLSLRDLNRELGWSLESDGDATTIAGYVINLAERIPDVGEEFSHEGKLFRVLGKVRNQITSISALEIEQYEDES